MAKALPLELQSRGHDVKVVLPCYSIIKGWQDLPIIAEGVLNQSHPDVKLHIPYKVRKVLLNSKVEVLLIDCPQYFDRTSMYGDNNEAYGDNGFRYAFFSAAAIETARIIGFKFDILHCNDWHTGLAPMLLRIKYANDPLFEKS